MHDTSRRPTAPARHIGAITRTRHAGRETALDQRHGGIHAAAGTTTSCCCSQELPVPDGCGRCAGSIVRHLASAGEEGAPNPLPRIGDAGTAARGVARRPGTRAVLPACRSAGRGTATGACFRRPSRGLARARS